MRDSFSRFSRVKSHLRKLKLRKFCWPRAKRVYHVSILSTSNYLAVLTPTKARHRVCLWRLSLKPSRKLKCYVSTDARTGRRNISTNVLGTFLATLEQTADIIISLCKQFLKFAQLLAVPLANPRVPDSPTAKIKSTKISETRILACFAKICTHENYQLYGS